MTALGSDTVLLTLLLFCRIGGCLMFMPGFSSSRVPMQVRLFLAVAATLAVAPLLLPELRALLVGRAPAQLLVIMFSEISIGAVIGLMGRMLFLALQFMATSAAMYMGFGNMPGAPIEDTEPLPPIATLVTLTATVLIFVTDQHWEIFRALVASYTVLPVTELFAPTFGLTQLTNAVSDAFVLTLQISAPFVVYAVIVNLLLGLINKLTPQIPVYFISMPFVLTGGLFLLYFTVGEFIGLFMAGFAGWLEKG